MTYMLKDGLDQPLIDLVAITPQPRSPGLQYTRRTFAADGTPVNEGPYVPLYWNITSKTQYQSLLTQFGLMSAGTNDITVRARDEEYDFVRYNGRAIKPVPGDGVDWSRGFPRNLTIIVRVLGTAA